MKSASVSHEARAQASGYERLHSIHGSIQRSLSESTIEQSSHTELAESAPPALNAEEQAQQEEEVRKKAVKDELQAYKTAGLWPEKAHVDLVRFWQVSTHTTMTLMCV